MPRQKPRVAQELDSLIPTLKSEEKRLQELLADARARADGIVHDAEARAGEAVQAARRDLPAFIEGQRRARRAELESGAAEAARGETEKTRQLQARARAAMDEAVRYIVSLVWPVAPDPPPVIK
jgi:vacuolar-type H+-ATPase subunit H